MRCHLAHFKFLPFRPPIDASVKTGIISLAHNSTVVQSPPVERIFYHPSYTPYDVTSAGDVTFIKLSAPLTYTNSVRRICLPATNVDVAQFKVCVATGFGATLYSGKLWAIHDANLCFFLSKANDFFCK